MADNQDPRLYRIESRLSKKRGIRHVAEYFSEENFIKHDGAIPFNLYVDVAELNSRKGERVHVIGIEYNLDQTVAVAACVGRNFTDTRFTNVRNLIKPYTVRKKHEVEEQTLERLRRQLEQYKTDNGVEYMPLILNNCMIMLSRIEKTDKVPRCDFILYDQDQPAYFISHKGKDHQQHSGIIRNFPTHPECIDFIKAVQREFPKGMDSCDKAMRPVKDPWLAGAALFGQLYRKSNHSGIHNCDCVMYGDLDLVRHDGLVYKLVADRTVYPDQPLPSMSLTARYDSGRGSKVRHCRLGIFETDNFKGKQI